jgi:hypothetical protein
MLQRSTNGARLPDAAIPICLARRCGHISSGGDAAAGA